MNNFFRKKHLLVIGFLVIITSAQAQCTVSFNAISDGLGVNGISFDAPSTVGGQPVQFYLWDFGDGSSTSFITQSNCHHNFPTPGTYSVQLKTYTDEICTGTQSVTVTDTNTSCNASFTYQPSLANWGEYTLQAQATSPNPPLTYIWNFGATASTETYQVNGAANEVCLTVVDNIGCTFTYCDTLYSGSPVLTPVYYIDIDTQNPCNNVIALPISFIGGDCQGQLVSEPEGSVDFDQIEISGDTLFLTICDDAQLIGITDSSGVLCNYIEVDFTLSVDLISFNSDVSLYPNPTSELLTIEAPLGTEYQLFDLTGKLMHKGAFNNDEIKLDLSDYNNGIYVLQCIQLGRIIYHEKIVKY